jgi:hypothetical protein
MGLGILLYKLAIILLVVVLPIVWLVTTIRAIRKDKNNGNVLDWKSYANATMKGFSYGILTLLIIAIVLFLLIYFFVDLSIS